MVKRILTASLMFTLLITGSAFAGATATTAEVYEKVLQAAEVVSSLGEEAFPAFNDPKGEFTWKENFVLVMDCKEGKIVAHPSPKLIGLNAAAVKDKKTGRLILKEACENVNPNGNWMEYWWTRAGAGGAASEKLYRKVIFILPVEGTPYQVGASMFSDDASLVELNGSLK